MTEKTKILSLNCLLIFLSYYLYFIYIKHKKLEKQYAQFISEKDRIRERAIDKYQTELMIRLQKTLEFDILKNEIDHTKLK